MSFPSVEFLTTTSANAGYSMRHLVVVLGMHRSGTSAVARALPVFGVDLGDRLMPAVDGENDKGYWEDLDIYAMNIEVLKTLGSDWHGTRPLREADFEIAAIQALRLRARELLGNKLVRGPVFGMKDPRLSRLLPFWKPIFRDLELQPLYVLATRNPLSVARSLQRRNGFPHAKSYSLWMLHCVDALCGTLGQARLCIDYDELMLDAPRQLGRLGRFLGRVPEPSAASEYCSGFLEGRLRRTRHFIGDLEADAGAEAAVCQLYGLLRRAAVDDRAQDWDPIDEFIECHSKP